MNSYNNTDNNDKNYSNSKRFIYHIDDEIANDSISFDKFENLSERHNININININTNN
jgi:hypothetical protein